MLLSEFIDLSKLKPIHFLWTMPGVVNGHPSFTCKHFQYRAKVSYSSKFDVWITVINFKMASRHANYELAKAHAEGIIRGLRNEDLAKAKRFIQQCLESGEIGEAKPLPISTPLSEPNSSKIEETRTSAELYVSVRRLSAAVMRQIPLAQQNTLISRVQSFLETEPLPLLSQMLDALVGLDINERSSVMIDINKFMVQQMAQHHGV